MASTILFRQMLFLIPIDVPYEAYSLDNLMQVLEPARRLRLVMLDACRDNPFVKSMKRTIASRAVGRGLAPVEPTSLNTMVGFGFAPHAHQPNSETTSIGPMMAPLNAVNSSAGIQ